MTDLQEVSPPPADPLPEEQSVEGELGLSSQSCLLECRVVI